MADMNKTELEMSKAASEMINHLVHIKHTDSQLADLYYNLKEAWMNWTYNIYFPE